MTQGRFFSFEAIDGVGKTTQVTLLADWLRANGIDVMITKEPGDARMGSNIGQGVRHLVFTDPSTHNLRPGVADMLFLADHIQTAGDIADAVEAGKYVICDRYADSQFAYATSPSKRTPAWALDVFQQNYGIKPDITFLLIARGPLLADVRDTGHAAEDISWALNRARQRGGAEAGKQDGKRWDSVEEQRRIQNAYLEQLAGRPSCRVIHCWETDTREEIHYRIVAELCDYQLSAA